MVRKNYIFVFAVLAALVSVLFVASAASIFNGIGSVTNTDIFYSPAETWINVSVSVLNDTGAASNAGVSEVRANFTAINSSACGGTGYLNLTYSAGGIWTGNCSVASFINVSQITPVLRYISFVAMNDSGYNVSTAQSVTIVLHNLGVPTMAQSGVRFGTGTTNMSNENNFNSVNLIFDVEGNLSQLTGGAVNLPAYQDVFLANFTNLNLSNSSTASALAQFGNAVQVSINSPKAFGDSRIYINTTLVAALNSNATLKFFNLPFASAPSISTDGGAAGVSGSLTWESNGYVSAFNTTTGNLTFSVLGFSGYNITDSVVPAISVISGTAKNLTTFMLNISVNGTGTEPSKIIINISNSTGDINVTTYNSSINTARCNATTTGGEFHYCAFNITLFEGNYTLNVSAWDYGGSSPGNAKSLSQALSIDTAAPSISLGFSHTSDTLNVTVTLTESGSGISSCVSNRGTVSGSGNSWNVAETGLSCETSYSYTINCTDNAGNSATRTESHTTSSCEVSDSGSSGGTTTSAWTMTYTADTTQFESSEGYSKALSEKERVRISIGNETHYVGIIDISSGEVTINVSSTPQTATLDVGESKKFEVTDDSYYDVLVKVNSINSTKANITMSLIHEKMPETPAATATGAAATQNASAGNQTGLGAVSKLAKSSIFKSVWFWVVIGALIIAGVAYYLIKIKKIDIARRVKIGGI